MATTQAMQKRKRDTRKKANAEQKVKNIIQAHKDGKPMDEICSTLNVEEKTVRRTCGLEPIVKGQVVKTEVKKSAMSKFLEFLFPKKRQ